jgi:putative transposase
MIDAADQNLSISRQCRLLNINRSTYYYKKRPIKPIDLKLMRLMGLEAIYPKRKTSRPHPAHKVYPYLLRNLKIDRPNQVWTADISVLQQRFQTVGRELS